MKPHPFLIGSLLSAGFLLLTAGFVAGFAVGGLTIDQKLDWSGLSAIGTLLAVFVALWISAKSSKQQHEQDRLAQRRDLERAILRMGPTILKAALYYSDQLEWTPNGELTHKRVSMARQCLAVGQGHAANYELASSGVSALRQAVEETIRETAVTHPDFRACLDHTAALARLVEEAMTDFQNSVNVRSQGQGFLTEKLRDIEAMRTIEEVTGRLVRQAWELKWWTIRSDYGQVPADNPLFVPPMPRVTDGDS